MKWKLTAAFLAAFFMSGCETIIATAITDSQAIHQAAFEFVSENIAHRRKVRNRCNEIIYREVDILVSEGEYDTARQKLKSIYTPLVTMNMISDNAEIVNEALVCG